jgi:hypothetical protein
MTLPPLKDISNKGRVLTLGVGQVGSSKTDEVSLDGVLESHHSRRLKIGLIHRSQYTPRQIMTNNGG